MRQGPRSRGGRCIAESAVFAVPPKALSLLRHHGKHRNQISFHYPPSLTRPLPLSDGRSDTSMGYSLSRTSSASAIRALFIFDRVTRLRITSDRVRRAVDRDHIRSDPLNGSSMRELGSTNRITSGSCPNKIHSTTGEDPHSWVRVIIASTMGSVMAFGISAIAACGLAVELLAGSNIIHVDNNSPADRALVSWGNGRNLSTLVNLPLLEALLII